MPPATVVDLVSSDEENDDARVEARSSGNGKRKIEAGFCKKEPNRKNPWFRLGTCRVTDAPSDTTLARRVSPGLGEEKVDEDDEVIVVEKPTKFTAAKASGKDATRTASTWAAKVSASYDEDCRLARELQAQEDEKAALTFQASPVVCDGRSADGLDGAIRMGAAPYEQVLDPPRIWWNSDNAVLSYGVLTSLRKSFKKGNLLLSNAISVPHIQQHDRWSCGFRNIQMLLSGLVPLLSPTHPYFEALMQIYRQEVPSHLLQHPGAPSSVLILPSLTQLQQQLEACWSEGFDEKGADHFKHSVVGRSSRIGAVEVGYVLAFWWLDACVVQFIKCFQSRRLLPPFVYHYFRGCGGEQQARAKALRCLERADKGSSAIDEATSSPGATILPMYLQWSGHSVTVIGIEPPAGATDIGKTNWSQWNLLVFCPARNCSRLMPSNVTVAPFRLSCRELLQKDCQLVLSSREPLSQHDRIARKASAHAVTAAYQAVMDYVAKGL